MTDFANVNGRVIPIPPRKPDAALDGSNQGGFFSRAGDLLLNTSKQTSQFFLNRELQRLNAKSDLAEARQMQRLREIENAGVQKRNDTFLGFNPDQQRNIVGGSSIAAIAMLGLAAVLIMRG